MKKAISVLALLGLLPVASGCGLAPAAETAAAGESRPGYFADYTELPDELIISSAQIELDDGTYLAGEGIEGKPVHGVYRDGEFEQFQVPADAEYFYAACESEGHIALLCGQRPVPIYKWLSEKLAGQTGEEESRSIKIVGCSRSGEILYEFPLSGEQMEQGADFFAMEYLEGCFYLLGPYHFLQLDSQGNLLNHIELYSSFLEGDSTGVYISMCRAGDEIFLCTRGHGVPCSELALSSGAALMRLDRELFIFEPVFQDGDMYPLGTGTDAAGKLLLFDREALYSLPEPGAELSRLLKWSEAGLYSISFTGICAAGDSQLMLKGNRADRLLRLSYGERSDERTELRLGCEEMSGTLARLVEEFNLVNDKYYVTVELLKKSDLSKVKLITGDRPDIYFFYNNAFLNGVNKSTIFEDLKPWLDKSAEEGQEMITASLREALEENGGQYSLPFDYMIWTMCTPMNIQGTEKMSMSELINEVRSRDGEKSLFQPGYTRSDLWEWICELSVEAFTDSRSGSCMFDSPEYIELMEACMLLPSDSPQEFSYDVLIQVEQVGSILRVNAFDQQYGENYIFTGCPTGGLSSGSAFEINQSFAMDAAGSRKEGVWEFFEFICSPNIINLKDISGGMRLPASDRQLEYLIAQASGEGFMYYGSSDISHEPVKISEYSARQLRALVDRTDTVMNKYPDIVEIMELEAMKYFDGQRSAEEAAAVTQSRAGIAMAERYG